MNLVMPWESVNGVILAQGDLLPDCTVPIIPPGFSSAPLQEIETEEADLIVLTQSCDLDPANGPIRAEFVVVCPVFSLSEWEKVNPAYARKGAWKDVKRGRIEGLHLLPPVDSTDSQAALVINFRTVYSLPHAYLSNHAAALGSRRRLQPPFVEHLSQTFGSFFMRVALPVTALDSL